MPAAISDEGNAIITYEGLSKLHIVYKHKEISRKINEFFKTDAYLYRLRSPHPSARLRLIEFYNFRCSQPPSLTREGFCWCDFARGLCVQTA